MEKNTRPTAQRTEEIQDIVERMPQNTGKFAIYIIVGLFLLFFVFGWIIKYPEEISCPVSIRSTDAPVTMVARASGKIILKKKQNDILQRGDVIGYIANAAELSDILCIDTLLSSPITPENIDENCLKKFPKSVRLGELTTVYCSFLKTLELCVYFPADKQYHYQKYDNMISINSLSENLQNLDTLIVVRRKSKLLADKLLQRDSIQYYQIKGIAESDFDKSSQVHNSSVENLLEVNKEYLNCKNQRYTLMNKYSQLELDEKNYAQKLHTDLLSGYNELRSGILKLINDFVLRTPVSGHLEFLDFWREYDNVQTGQELFSIIPQKNSLQGNTYLAISGAGKVKIGQQVNIQLDNYPYKEYGVIEGRIRNISMIAGKKIPRNEKEVINAYLVTIKLPNGLKTNFGTNLGFQHELKGVAEIITNKRRLLERLFDNLQYNVK